MKNGEEAVLLGADGELAISDDRELAIVLGDELANMGLESEPEPVAPVDVDDSPGESAERMIEALSSGSETSISNALRILVRATGAIGGGFSEWSGRGEQRVVAFSGAVEPVSQQLDVCCFFIDAFRRRAEGPFVATKLIVKDLHYACAAIARPGRELLTLVLWSADAAKLGDLSLLRVYLRLVDTLRTPLREPRTRRPTRVVEAPAQEFPNHYIPGRSRIMQELHRQMHLVAPATFPLLVMGETGVGKEHVVRILHDWSRRRRGPLVAVNCAAIPDTLLEAEMFGIGRGVASGVNERAGKFQLAEGGTLFLDEIGEMPLPLQAKLLRALQSHEVTPVGARSVEVDVRVIAATNSDLEEKIREGLFRSDLYYRLAGSVVRVPPLRERRADVAPLVEHFVRQFAAELDHPIRGLSVRTLELLAQYSWPGNVRELEHELRRLVYTCPPGRVIDSSLLGEHILLGGDDAPEVATLDLATRIAELERRTIRQALVRARGNRTVAAKLLGLSRNGLALKMQRHKSES